MQHACGADKSTADTLKGIAESDLGHDSGHLQAKTTDKPILASSARIRVVCLH